MKLKYFFITIFFISSTSTLALETNNASTMPGNTQATAEMSTNQNEGAAAYIASVMVIDNNEISAAKEALNRKLNPSVKAFAKLMINQHGQNLKEATRLSKKLGITPNFEATTSLKEDGDNLLSQLKPLDDSQFQKTYIDAMVKGHQDALGLLQDDISKVQNPKVKRFLTSTEKMVKLHLQKAQRVQTELAK